ncbi:hypothetical protein OSB04_011516 [Centaurea solstitialis]|uniref:Uncharacterized protein n=1 Tax=Centaurea solstitialis TaxID=347529 RepID=A0AA38TSN4_9ASTR|nr:hypothetical protein OSB04_011516 [Centaurea solstitialis]
MDSDDEIQYERDWDKTKRLEREKASLTTQLAKAVAQFKEKELHLKNHIKEQELQMKNQIKEKELQMINQIKEKELDFEKQIAETKLQCKKQIKESNKIIQFLDEKLHKIGVSERTIFLNKPCALRDFLDVKWGLGYENPNVLKNALKEKSAFYDFTSMLMSTRFPSLKGFEMKEDFSDMQEIEQHDPVYYEPKYHRVKFVYNSDTLRIKSKDSSNSSDFLVYPDINSSQESDVKAKPYVPTLVLEEKIVDLENLLKKTQSEYESLKFKEQNEHNAEREMLLEQIQILQQVVYESEHDLVNERSRFAKDREEYVQEILELQRTVADLQKLLEDKAGQEKQNVELEVAKERHMFETEIEKLTKTVSDLQNTLLEERKVFDLTSINLSKKISELERKIILDKKKSLKKPSLRAGKFQNMMHEFEEEIQGVHSVRKVDDKKCIELQKQIVDLQNQLSDVRHQFKQKEKVLRHEKSVLEQIIAEPKKPSLVEANFEDQKEVFKAEIRKLTSKLSELSTNIMNEQRMRSDQQKKLDDLLEERNKFSSKVKELEKTTFKAHDSSNVDSASLSNINSSGQIRTSNLFYDRRVDYSGYWLLNNSVQDPIFNYWWLLNIQFRTRTSFMRFNDIEVSMINPEPEDLPKKHIPRLDLVCEGVHEMNIETRHGPSVDNSCHPTKLLKYLLKDVCFNSHGELAHHLSNLHSEDLGEELSTRSVKAQNLNILDHWLWLHQEGFLDLTSRGNSGFDEDCFKLKSVDSKISLKLELILKKRSRIQRGRLLEQILLYPRSQDEESIFKSNIVKGWKSKKKVKHQNSTPATRLRVETGDVSLRLSTFLNCRFIRISDSRVLLLLRCFLTLVSKGPIVTFGGNGKGQTHGFGTLINGVTSFKRVACVKGLKHNLLSISQLCDKDHKVTFSKDYKSFSPSVRRFGVYTIVVNSSSENICFVSRASSDLNWLWHKPLSRLNFNTLN